MLGPQLPFEKNIFQHHIQRQCKQIRVIQHVVQVNVFSVLSKQDPIPSKKNISEYSVSRLQSLFDSILVPTLTPCNDIFFTNLFIIDLLDTSAPEYLHLHLWCHLD